MKIAPLSATEALLEARKEFAYLRRQCERARMPPDDRIELNDELDRLVEVLAAAYQGERRP